MAGKQYENTAGKQIKTGQSSLYNIYTISFKDNKAQVEALAKNGSAAVQSLQELADDVKLDAEALLGEKFPLGISGQPYRYTKTHCWRLKAAKVGNKDSKGRLADPKFESLWENVPVELIRQAIALEEQLLIINSNIKISSTNDVVATEVLTEKTLLRQFAVKH